MAVLLAKNRRNTQRGKTARRWSERNREKLFSKEERWGAEWSGEGETVHGAYMNHICMV